MSDPIPQPDALLELVRASLFNARDLLGSARLLLAGGKTPTAHALATLAFEEVGKSALFAMALLPPAGPTMPNATPKLFWAAIRSHREKIEWARGVLALLIREPVGPVLDTVVRLADDARADHLTKMRGLYVDYQDGRVLLPSAITCATAETLIDDVQTVLDVALEAWDHDEVPQRLNELVEHRDEIQSVLGQLTAMAEADPDGVMAGIRGLLRAGGDATQDDVDQAAVGFKN